MYEKEILEVYRFCDIRSFPVDLDRIIDRLGYRVVTYQDVANGNKEKLIKLMGISNDAFIVRRERTLYLNANTDRRRQRFTKAHEIGHIALPTNDEDAADAFAASILAPIPIARRNIIVTADYVCKTFDVSVAMANRVVMACKGKRVYDKHEKALIRYFDSFDEKEPRKKEPIRRRVEHRDDFPDNWNDLMLAKHDFDLYFY